MSQDTLTRKEIRQPDQVQSFLYRAVNLLHRNRNVVYAAAAVLVAVMLGGFAMANYYQGERIKQANLLYEAQKVATTAKPGDTGAVALAVTALEDYLKQFPGGPNAVLALINIGQLHGSAGKWADAEAAFKRAVDHKDGLVSSRQMARLSLATAYENQSKYTEAKAELDGIAETDWQDLKLKLLARIARAEGDNVKAKDYLEKIVNLEPASPLKQAAQSELLTLGSN